MTRQHKFPQIDYDEATGELKEIYDDIQATMRAPWVAYFCRVLALFPSYLPLAWHAARPNFTTRYAERAADALREQSLFPDTAPPDLRPVLKDLGWDDAQIDEVRQALDALNYGNPKFLLLITAWAEAFQNRRAGGASLSPEDAAVIPRGVPEGVAPLHLVDPATASPEVQELFERVKALHMYHGISSDYRVLANWPGFLRVSLEHALSPVVPTAEYDLKCRDLLIRARALVGDFPSAAGISADALADSCSPLEIAALTGLLTMYQQFVITVTVDMIHLKRALDGPEAAVASPFPIA